MSIALDQLPRYAVTASLRMLAAVRDVFGDDMVAAWLDGGTTFADRPLAKGDIDLCFVLAALAPRERDPREWHDDATSRPARVLATRDALAVELGVTFDTRFYIEHEMRGADLPGAAFDARAHSTGWAVLRAHWLAGQYARLHGLAPEAIVAAPTPAELVHDLDREVEHLERHVHEGDAADPYEATYAIWNGCRVLYTSRTGSPVISKRSAGAWGLEHLPERWHDAIRAAGRNYDGQAVEGDTELLAATMAEFVAMVRDHVPVTEPRPPGPPRWTVDRRD